MLFEDNWHTLWVMFLFLNKKTSTNVNCWFGLVVWDSKGALKLQSLSQGDPRNPTNPHHELTISWKHLKKESLFLFERCYKIASLLEFVFFPQPPPFVVTNSTIGILGFFGLRCYYRLSWKLLGALNWNARNAGTIYWCYQVRGASLSPSNLQVERKQHDSFSKIGPTYWIIINGSDPASYIPSKKQSRADFDGCSCSLWKQKWKPGPKRLQIEQRYRIDGYTLGVAPSQ